MRPSQALTFGNLSEFCALSGGRKCALLCQYTLPVTIKTIIVVPLRQMESRVHIYEHYENV